MNRIEYTRIGLHVVAVTRSDDGVIEVAVAFTQRGAKKRLIKGAVVNTFTFPS